MTNQIVYGSPPHQSIDAVPSAICTEGHTPQILGGIILWVLRNHFSAGGHIANTNLRPLVWNRDITQSQIAIEPVNKWKAENIAQRPGLFVKRGPWKLVQLGLGDNYLGAGSIMGGVNGLSVDSSDKYEILTAGSFTVFCVSKSSAESEELAWEATGQLHGFSNKIIEDMDLNVFRVEELGDVSKLEESQEHWVTPVGITAAFFHAWNIRQVGPMFKSVSMSTTE